MEVIAGRSSLVALRTTYDRLIMTRINTNRKKLCPCGCGYVCVCVFLRFIVFFFFFVYVFVCICVGSCVFCFVLLVILETSIHFYKKGTLRTYNFICSFNNYLICSKFFISTKTDLHIQ